MPLDERSPRTPAAGRLPGAAAVLLTGGTGVRLGGADKAALTVGGRTMLDLALTALANMDRTVVVGPVAPTGRPVEFVAEDPPSGGPAAGLLAGIDHLVAPTTTDAETDAETDTGTGAGTGTASGHPEWPEWPEWIVVLAVDMPRVTAATIARLAAAANPANAPGRHTDGAAGSSVRMTSRGSEPDGAVLVDAAGRAQLCAVLRRSAVERVRPSEAATGWGFFRLVRDLDLVEVTAEGDESVDVDTWDDLRAVTAGETVEP